VSVHEPKYEAQYGEGRSAHEAGLSFNACPYGMAEVGKRMSWLAGWYDRDGEQCGTLSERETKQTGW
jgi:ribosome modulation factor